MYIEQLAAAEPGNYEIEFLPGRGGVRVVYKARQIFLDHPVILNILVADRPVPIPSEKKVTADGKAMRWDTSKAKEIGNGKEGTAHKIV